MRSLGTRVAGMQQWSKIAAKLASGLSVEGWLLPRDVLWCQAAGCPCPVWFQQVAIGQGRRSMHAMQYMCFRLQAE